MSAAPSTSTSTSQSNFASIFNAALQSYKRKTKQDLPSHPLFMDLQSCNSPTLSSPSFESSSPHSTNLKMATKDSQNGSHRPPMCCLHFRRPLARALR